MSITTKSVSTLTAFALLGLTSPASAVPTCPSTSQTDIDSGLEFQAFAAAGAGGVIYDTGNSTLKLRTQGGSISSEIATTVPTQYQVSRGCSADFNGDTWPDFIGVSYDGQNVGYFRNDTIQNQPPVPDWNNPSYYTVPKFTWIAWVGILNPYHVGGSSIGCGDFNGDGYQDFFVILSDDNDSDDVYRADMWRGNGDGTFQSRYQLIVSESTFDDLESDATPFVIDYNNDGRKDFLYGGESSGKGRIKVYLNNGATPPMFTQGATLIKDIPIGDKITGLTYVDFTRDGVRDLAVGGLTVRGVKLYRGISGGGFDPPQTIVDAQWPTGTDVGPQVIVGDDFDMDGYNDLLVATNRAGGKVFIWNGKPGPTYIGGEADFDLTHTFTDTDMGFALDYDNDPAHTPDFLLNDWNGTSGAGAFTFANRLYTQYVACAEIVSGIVDLGPLAGQGFVISSARLAANVTLPADTSITWQMSNEDPPNWQQTNPCQDDPTKFCVSFPQPTGQAVRWNARLCSNPAHTATPSITQVQISFDYTLAPEHYRAGVVVNNGVAYVGGFSQPGESGHFYAINALLDTTYWDAAERLNNMADSARKVYTAAPDGITQIEMTNTASGAQLISLEETLGVIDEAEADALVNWFRGFRFGGGSSRMGSVLTSTPAILGPPVRPYYYGQMQPADKARYDAFAAARASRPTLILFGSKDGAIHAVRNNPGVITAAANGTEAWAYVPPRVAGQLVTDKNGGTANNYPDGSPTLADVKIGTQFRTVAIVGSGNGGKGFAAIDVTDTISTSDVVTGPLPLWDYVPGGSIAGQANAKAAVIRVRVSGVERFYAVMATGLAYDNPNAPWAKGLDVEAVEIGTGARAWRFRALCPVTTDMVAFETDDDLEPGSPAIDGFIDRMVFADVCGNVYKINPQQYLPGVDPAEGWIPGVGTIDTGVDNPGGLRIMALFQIAGGVLGEERPISGTIGLRPDETGRVALFFGTGGIEGFNALEQNVFYSLYADTGEVRDYFLGACNGPNSTCEKFYGGVVVTPEQVLVTRAIDPPVGTVACDFGSATVVGLEVTDLTQQFVITSSASVVSALYGDQGAIYATTLAGEVIRVGAPGQGNATATAPPNGQSPQNGAAAQPVKRRSWREVLY